MTGAAARRRVWAAEGKRVQVTGAAAGKSKLIVLAAAGSRWPAVAVCENLVLAPVLTPACQFSDQVVEGLVWGSLAM